MTYDLEKDLELSKHKLSVVESLHRLSYNIDYKNVFNNYMFSSLLLNYSKDLANFSLTNEQRNIIILKLTAISTLQAELESLLSSKETLVQSIKDTNETINIERYSNG
jgi:hypothetical protein